MQVFFLLLFVFCTEVHSANLSAPVSFSSSASLPKGVRNIRFMGVSFEALDRFDNSGALVPLGNDLNQSVTWAKIIDGKDTPVEQDETQAAIEKYLEESGQSNLDQNLGETTGVVNVAANVQAPVFAYGVTNKLTLAVAIPIYTTKLNVDTGFAANENLEAFQNYIIGKGNKSKSQEMVQKLENPIAKKLRDYNYEPLSNQEKTEVGDIKLVSKYRLRERTSYRLALSNELTLPTGKTADINRAVDIPSGDGQIDLGIGLTTDWFLSNQLTLSHNISYTRQFSDRRPLRIPEDPDSALTPDIDNNTTVDLGDKLSNQVIASYKIFKGWLIQTAYSFQYKERDQYSGDEYQNFRYQLLGRKTEQRMHAGQLGLSYSTTDLFREGRFFAPLGASVNYSFVMAGKNVTKDPLTAFELFMFF